MGSLLLSSSPQKVKKREERVWAGDFGTQDERSDAGGVKIN